jgi:chemotaxis protein histidine kinase CheA
VIEKVDAIFNETIFRDLHTVKGNAATYGFGSIADEIHQAESLVIQLQPSQALKRSGVLEEIGNRLQNCKKEIDYIKKIMARLFGKEDSIAVRIPKERIDTIQQLCSQLIAAQHEPTVARLIEQCQTLSWRPLSTLTRKYHRIVHTRAELLGKDVGFTVENGHTLWPADIFQSLDDSITHIVANAITHGIENKKSRYEQNKGRGTIRFRLERSQGMLSVSIADDGQGINTAELVRRSVEKGIIPAEMAGSLTEIQKLELIFAQGISTAESVTELSGRGVGMDVVREQIRMLEGTISIFSESGKGTTFTLRIPDRQLPGDPSGQDAHCESEEVA